MSRSQVERFVTHGCVTTFHVLWCIALFHMWKCNYEVQNFCWGRDHTCRGTETQMLFLKSPLWYVQLHCLLSPNRPTSFFSFPPPPSLEPAAVTSFPPHLLPQPYSGNMEPAFRVGCQHCYAHHSSYLLTQGVGGEEEVMAISSELCYLWVWGWIIPVIWIRDRHSGS